MSNNLENNIKVLLVGSGYMAREYAKVLKHLKIDFHVTGNTVASCKNFQKELSLPVDSGGLKSFLMKKGLDTYSHAINTVNVEYLKDTTIDLISKGIKNILIEKPGSVNFSELDEICKNADREKSEIYIAYNRRFYSSIEKTKEIINKDGGILSAHCEFTEWIHNINPDNYPDEIVNKWVIANSSHVLDTIFFLIGEPKILNPMILGKSKISWHPAGSIFIGSGISHNNIPFSYHSNWLSGGSWSIEILTTRNRLILKPMEELQIQKKGSIKIENVLLDNGMDTKFKPGIFNQVSHFLNSNYSSFCSIKSQKMRIKDVYNKIAGYN
tara:strand:+ start:1384 stop:2361 length:978 start_codon:yes stop_codon:yes gene_type:complete